MSRFLRRLAAGFRLVLFDRRGTGLSDRVSDDELPSLEGLMDDARAVLDAVGSEQAVVFAQGYGCPLAIVFAATYPERTRALILYNAIAKAGETTEDYPWGSTPEEQETWRSRSWEHWGSEVDRAGDGVFATFDGPGRAIRCACEIGRQVRQLGLQIRAGIHTGECELGADRVSGIAVHIGARIAALAAPGEVLVSSTVKDLVAGSELRFLERGLTGLKGIPGEWRLHALLTDAPQTSELHAAAPGRTQR